jgi:hypothetical protein
VQVEVNLCNWGIDKISLADVFGSTNHIDHVEEKQCLVNVLGKLVPFEVNDVDYDI